MKTITRTLKTILSLACVLGIASMFCTADLHAQATAKTINSSASTVSFDISNMKFNTVEGTFAGMDGAIKFDAAKLQESSFEVCIDASTVDTGNSSRDKHLNKDDFFYTEKHPDICFESTSIEASGSGYLAKGNLSLLGTTKMVRIPFTYTNNTFKGTLTIKRLDYGLGESTNTFMVGNAVDLVINCVVE